LQPVADESVPKEVLPLTRALNDLLYWLRTAREAQRKFIADAAHQLRTPLTSLKLSIENILSEDAQGSSRGALLKLRESVEQTTRLSNQLLVLARTEHGAANRQLFRQIDLVSLARETGAEWVPRALERNIDLSFHCAQESVAVSGDQTLLREAIRNLLDNAIKYHSGNGRVVLSIESGQPIRLLVEDDGPGIPVPLREAVFSRFRRGDKADGGGAGLGLAIVKEIASLHNGEVHLDNGLNGRGLRVLLTFPDLHR
jgi:two-component system sensor histidine kinase TctE